jgi:exodeoxyribonuclease-3
LKIATWNVNGIRARDAQLQEFIAREEPDVLCLQEIKATFDQLPVWLCEIEGYWCYWHGGKGYSGVALHVRRESFGERPVFHHPEFDYENRIVTARLQPTAGGEDSGLQTAPTTGDGDPGLHPTARATRDGGPGVPPVTVASIYVPNGGRDFEGKMRFLESLVQLAAEYESSGSTLVLCGDLNVARTDMDVHPKERKPRAIGQLPEERALIERIIGHGLVDVHRTLDPDNENLFTWWAPWRNLRQRNIGWRLDYVLASRTLAERAVSCIVQRETGTSDHGPVIAIFAT